ncbi:MAG: hypothetical protein IPK79_01430 [Vampirovibrionales bacterium]|nr:hypothetical protein [Vampirovibrionales bacterium]
MKAKDLAQILMQYPNLDVLVDGYEDGYEELNTVVIGKIVENYHTESYYGPHELLKTVENAGHRGVVVKDAFILKRMQRDQLNEQAFEKVLFEG